MKCDLVIFSYDRPLQLELNITSILKNVNGYNTIYIIWKASAAKFIKAYNKLQAEYSDIIFIDQCKIDFKSSLESILPKLTSVILLEVDDSLFYKSINISNLANYFEEYPDLNQILLSANIQLFNSEYFKQLNSDLFKPQKFNNLSEQHELILTYPYNVGHSLQRSSLLKQILNTTNPTDPIFLEIEGTKQIKQGFSCWYKEPVSIYLHLNNHHHRYSETLNIPFLLELFNHNFKIDIDKLSKDINNFESDLRWFNGEDIGRFPIFPWEIAPKYHQEILKNYIKQR